MTEHPSAGSPAIVVEHVTKIYRLYERPQQRILDVLGLSRRGKFTEHFALDDVTFTVQRGERLGIIGRNGAGKSTLLKLVSGVTSPSSGRIKVEGTARALLEIGTGFHPEFTGRENAKAYFAQLGIAGKRASELIDEVIDFSELEEYIDQPLKTYSTGMRLRLMFATSTVVAPDMLVLDEVLGVGDAYFTRKSFDRINEISHGEGATLLLVSHDIYTSARICDRMIWLEKGKVLFDGEPKDAVKAYEDSIRLQEEARLRSKSMLALQRDQDQAKHASEIVHIEVASPDGRPIESPVWFRSVRLLEQRNELAALPLFGEPAGSTLDLEGTCWGDISEWEGSPAREMRDFGSPFHKVGGTLIPSSAFSDLTDLAVDFVWGADRPVNLLVSCRAGQHLVAQREITIGGRQWEPFELDLARGADGAGTVEGPIERAGVFGTGRIYISGARTLDGAGHETFRFWHGDAFRLVFDYEIRDPDLNENCDIAVSIQRGGVDTACRVFTRSLRLSYADAKKGTVEMTLDRLMLGGGAYSITIQIARNGYYDREGHLFYTINPDVHTAVRQVVDFTVNTKGVVAESTSWVADGHWAIQPASVRLSRDTLSG